MKRRFLIFSILLGTLFFFTIMERDAKATCEGQTGAAFGLCQAAYAVGCDDPANDSPGCAKIESKFTNITGETPPWSLPPCPCGSSADFISMLDPDVDTLDCTDTSSLSYVQYGSLSISNCYVHVVQSHYPSASWGGETCSLYGGSSSYAISDEEALSCINEIKKTITHYGLICGTGTVPPDCGGEF